MFHNLISRQQWTNIQPLYCASFLILWCECYLITRPNPNHELSSNFSLLMAQMILPKIILTISRVTHEVRILGVHPVQGNSLLSSCLRSNWLERSRWQQPRPAIWPKWDLFSSICRTQKPTILCIVELDVLDSFHIEMGLPWHTLFNLRFMGDSFNTIWPLQMPTFLSAQSLSCLFPLLQMWADPTIVQVNVWLDCMPSV